MSNVPAVAPVPHTTTQVSRYYYKFDRPAALGVDPRHNRVGGVVYFPLDANSPLSTNSAAYAEFLDTLHAYFSNCEPEVVAWRQTFDASE